MTVDPPHDVTAEQALIGAALLDPDVPARVHVKASDFYRPHHETMWTAIVSLNGAHPDRARGLLDTLRTRGEIRGPLDGGYIHQCIQACVTPAAAEQYARAVHQTAHQRAALVALRRGEQRIDTSPPEDLPGVLYEAMADLEDVIRDDPNPRKPAGQELDAFLAAIPAGHDYLIPGLLERGDRVILTGPEGGGKSTLLRQIGVQTSSGIHPFDPTIRFPPLRVFLLDLENSDRQVHRALRPLRLAAGDRYAGGMVVQVRPEGVDLISGGGEALAELVADARPDLLIVGPVYKLTAADPTGDPEGPARVVAALLDKIRTAHACAVILEAHSPHAAGSKGTRPERPYGASLWLRWPEFGLHLSAEGDLRHWRGPRDERDWPAKLQRGGTWPWTPVTRERDVLWARIKALCIEAGDQLSYRDLAAVTGSSRGAVSRAIEEHRADWDALKAVS